MNTKQKQPAKKSGAVYYCHASELTETARVVTLWKSRNMVKPGAVKVRIVVDPK